MGTDERIRAEQCSALRGWENSSRQIGIFLPTYNHTLPCREGDFLA